MLLSDPVAFIYFIVANLYKLPGVTTKKTPIILHMMTIKIIMRACFHIIIYPADKQN